MHAAGIRADASTFEHIDPALVGNRRDVLVSELAGPRHGRGEGRAPPGIELGDDGAARVVERVKELEHHGYQFEAADASFELLMRSEAGAYEPLFRLESWRAIVEQRADGKVECEATIKIWIDGERYVRTAEGNGPVNALDAALRSRDRARSTRTSRDIELVNFKVRILDETHGTERGTRVLIDASDGQDVWGTIGVAENVIAASWQALVDSLEYAEQPGRGAAGAGAGGATEPARAGAAARRGAGAGATIPLARPVLGERGGARRRSRCCARGQLSLGPRVPEFERRSRRASARRTPAPSRAAPPGCTWRCARPACEDGERGRHVAVLVRRVAPTSACTSARGRSSPTSTRCTLNIDPQAAAAAVDRAHARAAAGPHLRLPGRHAGARARSGCRSSRTPARRSAPCTPTARAVGARGHAGRLRLLRQQAARRRARAAWSRWARPSVKERIDSERNQGRAPDMGWLDHDRLGFNYRLSDIACAIGIVQLEPPRRDARRPRARRRARTARRSPASRASSCRARTAAATPRLVRVRRAGARTASTATRSCARCASAACRASPTCRRST